MEILSKVSLNKYYIISHDSHFKSWKPFSFLICLTTKVLCLFIDNSSLYFSFRSSNLIFIIVLHVKSGATLHALLNARQLLIVTSFQPGINPRAISAASSKTWKNNSVANGSRPRGSLLPRLWSRLRSLVNVDSFSSEDASLFTTRLFPAVRIISLRPSDSRENGQKRGRGGESQEGMCNWRKEEKSRDKIVVKIGNWDKIYIKYSRRK